MHRYEQVDGAALDYDLTGNLLTDGSNSYSYDVLNRQIAMIGLDSTAEYVYDALGRRVAKIVDGVTTYYIYNAGYQVIEERDSSNQLLARYTYGAGIDEPLTMQRGSQTYYYHRDALGSITEITDASGALVERYEYDVYGAAQIFDTSGNPLTASAIENPYLFTGRRYDPESGNYYYRARIYSPTLGRFLQTDPLGYVDGLNLYAYVLNNPASWIDPWGLTVREGFADIFDPEETINVHRGARDVVGMAAGLGIIGLLDALLSEILSDDDDEDSSPSSTSKDEHEICSNNADPGTTIKPDVTDRVHDTLEELSKSTTPGRRPSTVGDFPPGSQSGWVDIDSLLPMHPANTGPIRGESQLGYADHADALADSIREKGFLLENAIPVQPLEDGRYIIMGGHHRVEALKRLGYTQVPVIFQENVWPSDMADIFKEIYQKQLR